jgi:hypothetical protein
LLAQGAVLVYLDEKWFYLFSQCKKSKHLPRAEFEPEGADRIGVRRVINKSYPVEKCSWERLQNRSQNEIVMERSASNGLAGSM